MTAGYAITTQNLSKRYGEGTWALRGLSIQVERGAVYGFLGPNGSGKTTTVKLLAGLIAATEGEANLFGETVGSGREALRKECGLLTETAQVYEHMTARENLMFYGKLFGMDAKDCETRSIELLAKLELEEAEQCVRTFSTGMKKRLAMARTLLHRPKLLFLDEPTSGLDPESAQSVNAMIHELAKNEGVTVFLCTHQLRYAAEICTRYGLIWKGSLMAQGGLDELAKDLTLKPRLSVRADRCPEGMQAVDAIQGSYERPVEHDDEAADLLKAWILSGTRVYEAQIVHPTLEEIYFHCAQKAREGAGA